MARRRKGPGAGPGHTPETAGYASGTQITPREVEPRRAGPTGTPRQGNPEAARGPEQSRGLPTERSEDFAERRDVETADEPVEAHDRRHHRERRGRSDVESGQSV